MQAKNGVAFHIRSLLVTFEDGRHGRLLRCVGHLLGVLLKFGGHHLIRLFLLLLSGFDVLTNASVLLLYLLVLLLIVEDLLNKQLLVILLT